jgi:hypothetical protein
MALLRKNGFIESWWGNKMKLYPGKLIGTQLDFLKGEVLTYHIPRSVETFLSIVSKLKLTREEIIKTLKLEPALYDKLLAGEVIVSPSYWNRWAIQLRGMVNG